MTNGNQRNLIVLILAVIGGIAVIAVLGMWLMHGTMGGMMGGGGMIGGAGWLIGLLIFGALIALAVVLARRRT